MFDKPASAVGKPTILRNEFATVAISIDRSGNGGRLEIADVTTGEKTYLEPLELATLAKIRTDDLGELFDRLIGPR